MEMEEEDWLMLRAMEWVPRILRKLSAKSQCLGNGISEVMRTRTRGFPIQNIIEYMLL